jgi:hypothetical protein
MALTAVAIKNAKGREKAYKLTDSDGLFLYVTPAGGRYWRMNYRYLGKQKTLAFGVNHDTGLADAREQRDVAAKCWRRATILPRKPSLIGLPPPSPPPTASRRLPTNG